MYVKIRQIISLILLSGMPCVCAHIRAPLAGDGTDLAQATTASVTQGHEPSLREGSSAQNDHISLLQGHNVLGILKQTLHTLEDQFFTLWLGIYPTAIDWTGAVINTHLAAALTSITTSSSQKPSKGARSSRGAAAELENEISSQYSHITAYYYNEDAFAIRTQAHDDMLWVVLGWLESLKFISTHSDTHHLPSPSAARKHTASWHGTQYVPAFAHRARIFYEIVADAWDDTLCGGGLTWDPKLEVYKNSITNTQFLAASVGMYLYWPGDDIDSPFFTAAIQRRDPRPGHQEVKREWRKHDPEFLANAFKTHEWLRAVRLATPASHGLYIDGYHILHPKAPSEPSQCNIPNPQSYSYNQGVVLSGLRGLYIATGIVSYLDEGFELIAAVVSATHDGTLGIGGILAEQCDIGMTNGTGCSQDAQTFKGVFMLHFGVFCEPLTLDKQLRYSFDDGTESSGDVESHRQRCKGYTKWVVGHANAALATRNARGVLGGSWLVGAAQPALIAEHELGDDRSKRRWKKPGSRGRGEDIRGNSSLLQADSLWCGNRCSPLLGADTAQGAQRRLDIIENGGQLISRARRPRGLDKSDADDDADHTLETHASGMAAVRAAYEFLRL